MTVRNRVPYLVLGAALLLTGIATYVLATSGREREIARFQNAMQAAQDRIRTRLETHLALLRGGSGLFVASDTVREAEFRAYVSRLRIQENYPGIQGFGYTRYVRPEERAGFLRTMSAVREGFRIWPEWNGETHAIVYLEPQDRRNRVAIGYNMFSEPVRREAMTRARDRGEAVLSGKVQLVQEIDPVKQPGFLIYVPVYGRGELPATVDERRRQFRGYVYAPFRAHDLFEGLFGTEQFPRVRVRVYDSKADSLNLLYDSEPAARPYHTHLHEFSELTAAGRTWVLEFTPTQFFVQSLSPNFAPAMGLLGVLLSIVLFTLTRAQAMAQERAERSQQTRSRFLATMSHELRTPLNAIIGYNDLLLAGIYGPLTEAQSAGIERGQKAALHLLELVNDVLDLSKIEADKLEITPETILLPELIDDLLITIRPMVERAGSSLEIHCQQPANPVTTDPRRLRQILLNLLSNAAKFGRGNPIRVECANAEDGGVMISVSDHGIGIADDQLQRIFEEFVQLNRTEGPAVGTGLGLPISRRLAERIGGRLDVHSTVGQGSTFTLILPRTLPSHVAGVPRFRS